MRVVAFQVKERRGRMWNHQRTEKNGVVVVEEEKDEEEECGVAWRQIDTWHDHINHINMEKMLLINMLVHCLKWDETQYTLCYAMRPYYTYSKSAFNYCSSLCLSRVKNECRFNYIFCNLYASVSLSLFSLLLFLSLFSLSSSSLFLFYPLPPFILLLSSPLLITLYSLSRL